MTTVAEQLQYESRLRFRFAVISFVTAVLLVVAQLIQLSGPQPPVNEATVTLITQNQRGTLDIVGAAVDMLGLCSLAVLMFWLHRLAQARQPQLRSATRYTASVGAVLAGVMALVYTVIFAEKANQFVTTGNQSFPEASHLFSSGLLLLPGLLLELGNLMLAIGTILVALSVMRVGLFPRPIGYAGVLSGALFIIGVPVLAPVIQGLWLAATAVLLAGKLPKGDPPAWQSGVAVPWTPLAPRQGDQRGTKAQRRRRVSDQAVLAAVERGDPPPNPRAGRAKRKRRK
jgi:hypothetical protein